MDSIALSWRYYAMANTFIFFNFLDRKKTHATPQFSLGKFPDGHWRQAIDEMDPADDPTDFMRQTRLVCESLYYVFLNGYRAGLQAYWNRCVERGKSRGTERQSTPGWHKATVSAAKALEEAKSAWNQRQEEGKLEESKISAKNALQFLSDSVAEAPLTMRGFSHYLTD